MLGHRKCYSCGKIGHKEEMEKKNIFVPFSSGTKWFHLNCLEDFMGRIYNLKRCNCGKEWVGMSEKDISAFIKKEKKAKKK